jgi:hypothetical protein
MGFSPILVSDIKCLADGNKKLYLILHLLLGSTHGLCTMPETKKWKQKFCRLLFFNYLCIRISHRNHAPVAELVDAPDLGSGVSRRAGSSPVRRTSMES